MKTSAIGRAALISREAMKLTAYRDSVGIWTIGVGHTAACGAPIPRAGLTITRAEAEACLERDLAKFERAISAAVKVPLANHEFDALVSFAYNVGEGGAAKSSAIRKLNAGDRHGAAEAFLMWTKPAEITSRRQAERDQFLTPYEKAMPKGRRSDKSAVAAPPRTIIPPPKLAVADASAAKVDFKSTPQTIPQPAARGLFHAPAEGAQPQKGPAVKDFLAKNKGKIISVILGAMFAGAGLASGQMDAATALAKFVAIAGLGAP